MPRYVLIDDDQVVVPKELTSENGAKAAMMGEFYEEVTTGCPNCNGEDYCELCNDTGEITYRVAISWTTIKKIWGKAIGVVAAPQPAEQKSTHPCGLTHEQIQAAHRAALSLGENILSSAIVAIFESISATNLAEQKPVATNERLPTKEDATGKPFIWAWDSKNEEWVIIFFWIVIEQPKIYTYWQPTGLTMPQPPQEIGK